MRMILLVPMMLLAGVQLAWGNENAAVQQYTLLEPEAVRPLTRQTTTVCVDVRTKGERRGQVDIDHPDGEWWLKCHRTVQVPFDTKGGNFSNVALLKAYRNQAVKLVVYCQVGVRSAHAARYMVQALGFQQKQVYAVDGGLDVLDFEPRTRVAVHGRPPSSMMTGQ